jgi:hypothetical protein
MPISIIILAINPENTVILGANQAASKTDQ